MLSFELRNSSIQISKLIIQNSLSLKTNHIGRNRVTRSVNAPPPVSPKDRTRTM